MNGDRRSSCVEKDVVMDLVIVVVGAGDNVAEQKCSTACFGTLSSRY